MKTNLSFLLFAGVMTMSSMIMNSCSSDEDERTEVPTQPEMQKSDKLQQISEVVNQANQKLAALDLSELQPLTRALEEEAEANPSKINEALMALLKKLNQDFSRNGNFLKNYSFKDAAELFELTYNAVGEVNVGSEDSQFFTGFTGSKTANYIVNTPEGVFEIAIDRTDENSLNDDVKLNNTHTVFIKKDDAVIVSIGSTFSGENFVAALLPLKSVDYTGIVNVKGTSITLAYNHESIHERSLQLTIQQDGETTPVAMFSTTLADNVTWANLIKHDVVFASDYTVSINGGAVELGGHINNVNQFMLQAQSVYKMFIDGDTEEKANEAATKFNENTTIFLSSAGVVVGDVYIAPVFDEETGKYKLTMMVTSSLFGEEPVDISAVLSSMGVSIDDIKQLIIDKILNQ